MLDVESFDDPRVEGKLSGMREFGCSIGYYHFRKTKAIKDGPNLSIIVVGNGGYRNTFAVAESCSVLDYPDQKQ